ncbi:MAG: hypothetical protein JNL73_24530 [Anaerolineales bacterium]|nr:hypothetical protein [Anaerolineales bacterium]
MTAPEPLRSVVEALDRGDRTHAEKLLARLLREQPRNDQAWVLMAETQTDPQRQRDCLNQALRINPANEIARLMLEPAPAEAETVWHHGEAAVVDSETLHAEWSGWDENGHAAEVVQPAPIDTEDLRAVIDRARKAPPSLEAALTLSDLGQTSAARHMLRHIVKNDPANEMSWVALLELTDDDAERAALGQDATRHHPRSPRVAAALGQPTPVIETHVPVVPKTPLELIQERAAREGEPVGPIRARRVIGEQPRQIFFEIWMSALLGPTKSNFEEILDNNPPSLLAAMTWMGLCGGIATLVQFGILFGTQPELRALLGQLDRNTLLIASVSAIVAIWIMPALGLLFNSLAVAIASVIVGGNLDIRAQAFLTAAWQAPLTLVTSVVAFVPVVNVVAGIALVIYEVVLSITATQAAQDLDGFKAVVALILSAVVAALPFCLIGMFAPAVMSEVAQALQAYAP